MDTEFNVIDLYETFTTDFDVAAFQYAVWPSGITRLIVYPTAQMPMTVLTELREPVLLCTLLHKCLWWYWPN
jgi:hypothetical protein